VVGRPTVSLSHCECDLLCLKTCPPQQYCGELGTSTDDNVIKICRRACYVTFYIKMLWLAATMSRLCTTIVNDSRDIAWEGYDYHPRIAATIVTTVAVATTALLLLLLGVCRMRVRNPAINSLSGNIWIRRIFQYSDLPESRITGFRNPPESESGNTRSEYKYASKLLEWPIVFVLCLGMSVHWSR